MREINLLLVGALQTAFNREKDQIKRVTSVYMEWPGTVQCLHGVRPGDDCNNSWVQLVCQHQFLFTCTHCIYMVWVWVPIQFMTCRRQRLQGRSWMGGSRGSGALPLGECRSKHGMTAMRNHHPASAHIVCIIICSILSVSDSESWATHDHEVFWPVLYTLVAAG